jgi:sulfite reductase (ferredoxin)
MTDTPKKLVAQEGMKENSHHLRGNILADLRSDALAVTEETYELLKFHGSYEGYDRDTATDRKKAGLEKEYEFMLRMRIPGGRLGAKEYLVLDALSDKYANGTLKITTRETIQFHVIMKGDFWNFLHEINVAGMTTIAGCGDVVRNVMATPAPIKDNIHDTIQKALYELDVVLKPKTKAYHEIWVNGEVAATSQEEEPLYGETYLPRKFKVGVCQPEDNSIDLLSHDLGFAAHFNGQELEGYNVYLGGGQGIQHNNAKTYPRIASPICFIPPQDLAKCAEAVVKLQRDNGDRSDRKHARLKYVVEEQGLEWTRKTLEEYFGAKLADPKPERKWNVVDHMGWHDQKDGKLYLGVPIESGRIKDWDVTKYRSAVRDILKKYGTRIIFTADQNIIFCDVEPAWKEDILVILKSHNVPLREDITNIARHFLSCVALPTCGKALAEAERITAPVIKGIEGVMEKNGVLNENIAVHMTGCPNGCARPYVGDIGIVGRMPGHYVIFIGGDSEFTRLNTLVFDKVPEAEIPAALDPMFALYAANKNAGEGFGDFCTRYGIDKVKESAKASLTQYKWAA